MKTKSFGNERLKCLFSQVQGDYDLQKKIKTNYPSQKREQQGKRQL
jgi:hypothetical protein